MKVKDIGITIMVGVCFFLTFFIFFTTPVIDDKNVTGINVAELTTLCLGVNYTLNMSENITTLSFPIKTWKQYGVAPINQTNENPTWKFNCEDYCDVYVNAVTNISGIVLKIGTTNEYYNSNELPFSEENDYIKIYDDYIGNHSIWIWADVNRPNGTEYINVTYKICGGVEDE